MRTGHVDHETGLWVDDGPPDELGEALAPSDIGLASQTRIAGDHPGMVEPGNIDLTDRPDIANPDGSRSTVRSLGFSEGGPEILVPTVVPGRGVISDDDAIAEYRRTGQHLGKFQDVAASNAYAEALHRQQAGEMNSPAARARAIKAARAAGPAPFALPNYAQPEDTAGPVTDQTMADTRAAKIREIQDSAGMIGDQDKSRQTYENVNRGLSRPENRDLTMDDIVTPETQQADRAERLKPARDFARFAGAGAAGELAAPLVGRGVSALADKARAIRAARAAANGPRPISDPAALMPVERGPEPEFWSPRDADHGADLFETPSTMERTANIRLPQHRSP